MLYLMIIVLVLVLVLYLQCMRIKKRRQLLNAISGTDCSHQDEVRIYFVPEPPAASVTQEVKPPPYEEPPPYHTLNFG